MTRPTTATADRLWLLGLTLGLPLLAMLLRGQDSNWDLRNYHLYNPYAWLTGRMAIDIAPAQLQSWHNPLLDVPLYLIVNSGWSPRWASLWLTLPSMLALYCLLRLQAALSQTPPTRIAQAALALLAITGAATYSTLGLSMNDAFVAAAMLASLLALVGAPPGRAGRGGLLLAGLLAGAIAGLKLSASFYCLALAAATALSALWLRDLRRLAWLVVGGVVGFVLSYGYWGWLQATLHGNPFFPYFNNLFHSPDALALPYADARFRPTSLFEAALAPVHLLQRSLAFSELKLSDPRLLLGLLACAALWLLERRQVLADPGRRLRLATCALFFLVSFLLWIGQYAIYRYAIVLELLATLAFVLLLQRLPRGASGALLLAVLLVNADTKRPNWGHDGAPVPRLGIQALAVPADSLVLIASEEPLAYLALGLPARVPLVAVANNLMSPHSCTRLQQRAAALIAAHAGPLWLLNDTLPTSVQAQPLLARYYGLQPAGTCVPVVNGLAPAQLCPLRRVSPSAPTDCRAATTRPVH